MTIVHSAHLIFPRSAQITEVVALYSLDPQLELSIMSFSAKSNLPKQYDSYDFISPSRFTGKLKGKVAVITGASGGIGKTTCLAFAAAGANVACVARKEAALNDLVSEIKTKHSGTATAVVADVSDPASSKKIVSQVEQELGPVDILLNCAGITRMGALAHEEDFATWWRVLEVNLRGPAALTHAVLPSMIERKTGIVMTISSMAGASTVPILTSYASSKAAVIKFHQDLAHEVERHGIRSYSFHPGTLPTMGTDDSVMNPKSLEEEPAVQQMFEEFKDLKYQSPELFANTVVAVCADERFKALNGRFIDCEQPVDKVLEEAEKPDGGRVGKENMYHLKLDEL